MSWLQIYHTLLCIHQTTWQQAVQAGQAWPSISLLPIFNSIFQQHSLHTNLSSHWQFVISPLFIKGVRTWPNSYVLFLLIPYNNSPGVKAVIKHNHHFVSRIFSFKNLDNLNDVKYGINISFYISNKSTDTFASIEQNNNIVTSVPSQDVWMWKKISHIQCIFEMHPENKSVLLYNQSFMCIICSISDNIRLYKPGQFLCCVMTNEKINDKFTFPVNVQFRII